MRPHFLIVGAASSGTSTLHDYLRLHDDLFLPEGEPHFFSKETTWQKGPGWYEACFAAAPPGAIVGEKSASYYRDDRAPERIHRLLPEAKLVWIFREPIARAHAHYWRRVARGREPLPFEAALAADTGRSDDERGYVRRGRYADLLEPFLERFPRERMLFLLLDDLKTDPLATVNRLLEFVGAPTWTALPQTLRSNARTRIPRSRHLQHWARRAFGEGRAGYRAVARFNLHPVDRYPAMRPETRRRLEEQLLPQVERLEKQIGRDLAAWRP